MSREAMKLALESLESCGWNDGYAGENQYFHDDLVDKAITALREALAAQQEPVAWMTNEVTTGTQVWLYEKTAQRYQDPPIPLYTSPPAQRTWVGLTDEEVINVMPDDDTPMSLGEAFSVFAELIEAKLRSKNT